MATAPRSPLARCPLSLLLRGTLRARRAQAKLPWRPQLPVPRCPQPPAQAGAAGALLPQARSGHSFPLLLFFCSLFEIPLWDRAVWRSHSQKRQKMQKSPCSLPLSSAPTGAPPAPSLPRPATSAAAGGGGRAGPAAQAGPREEGGLAFVPRSPSGCVRRPPAVQGQRRSTAERPRAPGFSDPAQGAGPASMAAPHSPRRGGRGLARRDPLEAPSRSAGRGCGSASLRAGGTAASALRRKRREFHRTRRVGRDLSG